MYHFSNFLFSLSSNISFYFSLTNFHVYTGILLLPTSPIIDWEKKVSVDYTYSIQITYYFGDIQLFKKKVSNYWIILNSLHLSHCLQTYKVDIILNLFRSVVLKVPSTKVISPGWRQPVISYSRLTGSVNDTWPSASLSASRSHSPPDSLFCFVSLVPPDLSL